MVGKTYFILLFVLRMDIRNAFIQCPEHCLCEDDSLNCYSFMPKFIPDDIKKVTIRAVEFGKRFSFKHSGWKNVTQLAINPGDTAFHVKQEPPRTLHGFEFHHLKNLEYLQLACTCLHEIDAHAFQGLELLVVLDLSNNVELSISQIAAALEEEHILPRLRELYFSNTSVVDFFPFVISRNFYDAVRNRSLKVLDISHTEDAWFDKNGLVSAFPDLETLNASNAGIGVVSLGHFFHDNAQSDGQSFQNLKCLDVSYPTVSSKLGNLVFGSATHDVFTYLPFDIEAIYARGIFPLPLEIRGESNKTHACMSGKTYGSQFQWCIVGTFRHLYTIDFSENMIEYLDPNLLKYPFAKLKNVYISKNKLGPKFLQDEYVTSLMKLFPDLEVLDLSSNAISGIPRATFEQNKRLRRIILSGNQLDTIGFEFAHLIFLQHLDLEHNNIMYLDSATINSLQNLLSFQNQSVNSHNNTIADTEKQTGTSLFTVFLKNNPIKCCCRSLPFLNWLLQMNDTFMCALNGRKTEVTEYSIRKAAYECKSSFVIIIFSILSFIEVITISVMTFVIIKEVRKRRIRKKTETGIELFNINHENKNPVVFLSFCSEDGDFVMSNVYTNLNKGLQKILKTTTDCVSTGCSSFLPGFAIGDEIIRCIESASVTVFFVSTTFCSKSWCRNEAMVAHCERKPIVLMLWDNVETKQMPKSLYKHYLKYTRAHWIRENGELVMKPGWDKLCEAIVRLIGNDPLA